MRVNRLSDKGLALLCELEDLRLEAYQDSADIWTIGYGTIRYPDGKRVAKGDVCTAEHATTCLRHDVERTDEAVDDHTIDTLTQNQHDALVVFAYNVGVGREASSQHGASGFVGSTLRSMVNSNPNDPGIRMQFMRWHKVKGKPVYGLWRRRHIEADLYFDVTTKMMTYPFARS